MEVTPPTSLPEEERQQNWSSYWQHGALHSLGDSMQDNYAGAIGAFWSSAFDALQPEHRVLDICTGNGPLPALLWNLRGEAMPRVDAVDAADIAPGWLQHLPAETRSRIHFHGRTQAEMLPFVDESFDLVASQYGLEYTRMAESIPQLVRTLKPGGELALVLHHAQSRLVEVAREELRLSAWLEQDDALLDRAMAILPYLAMAAAGEQAALGANPLAASTRTAFNAAMQRAAAMIDDSPVPDLLLDARERVATVLQAIMQRQADVPQATAWLQEFRSALTQAAFRHHELCSHALDDAGLQLLGERLNAAGMTAHPATTISEDGMVLGWALTARKR